MWCCGSAVCCADEVANTSVLCRPDAHGLVINEWLANPQGPDAHREWVELRNEGNETICLNRAEWRVRTPSGTHRRPLRRVGCLAPNECIVLGDGTPASRASAGGQPVDFTFGHVELPNTGATLEVGCQQAVLASVSYGDDGRMWPTEAPSPLAGRSTARIDLPGRVPTYCNVITPPYDGRDMGTPGADNLACVLCEDGHRTRPQHPPANDELQLTAVYADPPGADRDREWLRLRSTASVPVDLLGLRVEIEVPGRRPRRLLLASKGCSPLSPGDTLHLPVLAAASSAHHQALIGPTLPNKSAWYRLWWQEQCIQSVWVPAPIGHACVLPDGVRP